MNDQTGHRTVDRLLVATSNPGKITELRELLSGAGYEVLGLEDLTTPLPSIEETGNTYKENAFIKADHYHSMTGILTIADDSGLAVDALEGRPGVFSARYGGDGLTSADQVSLLLDEMIDIRPGNRGAEFICSIAIVGTGIRQAFEGRCRGEIALSPRGSNGFGYDPVFIDESSGLTFAEMDQIEKSAISHRGKALRQAIVFLGGPRNQNCDD